MITLNEILEMLKEQRKKFEQAFDNVGNELSVIQSSGKIDMGKIKTIIDFIVFMGNLKEKYVGK